VEPARPVPRFTISEAVTYSWNACLRNAGSYLLVSLVVFVGNTVVVLVAATNNAAGFQVAFEVLGALIDLLLLLGLIRASLDVVDGITPRLGMVFRPDGYGPYLVASIFFLGGTYLGLLLIVPGVVFAVVFQFYGYVVAEHPDIGATAALRRSAEITRGARLRLIGLAVVLVCVNLAGATLCVVGLIVTYGISALALAYTYRVLSDRPVALP
jgi:uncharacterized membrane protein